jgi:hypothetical protein
MMKDPGLFLTCDINVDLAIIDRIIAECTPFMMPPTGERERSYNEGVSDFLRAIEALKKRMAPGIEEDFFVVEFLRKNHNGTIDLVRRAIKEWPAWAADLRGF